jgi:chromosome segregation ATPase
MTTPTNDNMYDLKQYIKDTLGVQITELARAFEDQNRTLRSIEITTTTNIAEIRKDIQQLQSKIIDLEKDHNALVDTQKFKWKSLTEEREREKEARDRSNIEQAKVFDRMNLVIKLLWTFCGLAGTLIFGLLWQILISGGIKNLP